MRKIVLSKDHVKEAFKDYLRRYYAELRKSDFDLYFIVPGEYHNTEFEIYIKDDRNEKTTAQLSFKLDDDLTSKSRSKSRSN
jgi:hypothetical protein